MSKKLITACLGLLALAAFALPAVASAANDPQLTEPTGTLLTGTPKILATNVTNPKLTGADKETVLTECTKSTLTGELTKNTGGNVEGTISTATFTGTGPVRNAEPECTSPKAPALGNFNVDTNIGNGTPWCLRSTTAMAEDEFQVRGGSCAGEAKSITFVLTSTLITSGPCKYNREAAMKGTFTTDTSGTDAILHLENQEFKGETGNPVACPTVGLFDGSYTLETDTVEAAAIYIS